MGEWESKIETAREGERRGRVEAGRRERDTDAGTLMQVCILPAQELARCGV